MGSRQRKLNIGERIGIIVCSSVIVLSAFWVTISRGCSHKPEEMALMRADSIAREAEEAREAKIDAALLPEQRKTPKSRSKKQPAKTAQPPQDMSRDYFAPEEKVN